MIFRTFTIICVAFLACIAIVAQKRKPVTMSRIVEVRVQFVSNPEIISPVSKVKGGTFNLLFTLPKLDRGRWTTSELTPLQFSAFEGSGEYVDIEQGFNGSHTSELEAVIMKVRHDLKKYPKSGPVREEDVKIEGIIGRVLSYWSESESSSHHMRVYVFAFNGGIFQLRIGSNAANGSEWSQINGEAILKSFTVTTDPPKIEIEPATTTTTPIGEKPPENFITEPLLGSIVSGDALSLDGQVFHFDFMLPKVSGGNWANASPTAAEYLFLAQGAGNQYVKVSQKFPGGPPASLDDAINKIRAELKRFEQTIRLSESEEEINASGMKGKVLTYSVPLDGFVRRLIRVYVFSFNNALFQLDVGSAAADREEWVKKEGDAVLMSLRVR